MLAWASACAWPGQRGIREHHVLLDPARPELVMLSDGSAPIERAIELLAAGQREQGVVLLASAARTSLERPDIAHYALGQLAEYDGDREQARNHYLRAYSLERERRYWEAARRCGAELEHREQ